MFMVKQNFVRTFREDDRDSSFSESVRIPCIILFYPYCLGGKVCVDYCHFDEKSFGELKSFIETSGERNVNKIAVFGGYGSRKIKNLFGSLRSNGLSKLTDKSFSRFPPVKNIGFCQKGFVLTNEIGVEEFYSFRELESLFR